MNYWGVFLILFFSLTTLAQSPSSIWSNNSGVESFAEEFPLEAYEKFLQALQEEPFEARYRLNLGRAFEENEEKQKAFKEYMAAVRYSRSDDVKFYGLFNAARLAAESGQIEEALELYQDALNLRPDSQEVKTNIELLWKNSKGQGSGDRDQKNPSKNQNDDQKKKGGQGEQNQKKKPNQNSTDKDKQSRRKKKPKPFKSRELTKDDVRKILEEIKNQEQKVRAKAYKKSVKERPDGKDW